MAENSGLESATQHCQGSLNPTLDVGIKPYAKTSFLRIAREECERPVGTLLSLATPVKRDSFFRPASLYSSAFPHYNKMPEMVNLKEKRFCGSRPPSVGPRALDSQKGPHVTAGVQGRIKPLSSVAKKHKDKKKRVHHALRASHKI